MRRKDRQREEDFAWRVFDQAPYGVLSMRDGEGGYGVPVSPARVGEKVYFHCAMEGKKLDCLCQWPEASMALVTDVGPDYFAITFRSAVLRGRVTVVTDEDEEAGGLARHLAAILPGTDGRLCEIRGHRPGGPPVSAGWT